MPVSSSLRSKTLKGFGWSAIDQIANQGISFLVSLILARLLSPDEYGLIGIITIFILVFNAFIVSGFNTALIRKTDADDKDYNTVFVFNLTVSIVLFIFLWYSAPLIADFFSRVELIELTRVMGFMLIINAFALIQSTILTKEIDFKKQTKISLIASTSSGIIGITMALYGLGVWSLVGQQLSRQTLNTFLLWYWSAWRPKLTFYKDRFVYLWTFGWKLLCAGLIDTLWKEIYQVVIGKFYTPAALGQYTRAQQFSTIFSYNLTSIVQRVSFPVLSSIQDDKLRLKEGYRKIIKTTMFVTFVLMFGLASVAKPMILVLIGEKWEPCIFMLQLVCLNMMLYPLHAINLNMLQVQGRSDLFLKLEIYKKIIAVVPILLGTFYSIYAMLIASIVDGFISYYLNAYYTGSNLGYNFWQQVKDILPSFCIAVVMAVPVYLMSFLPLSPFVILPLQIVVGATIVFAICELTKIQEYIELKGITLGAIHKITRK